MESCTLRGRYGHLFGVLSKKAKAPTKISEENVYQEANKDILPYMDGMLADNFLPGSRIEGLANFNSFLEQVKSGKRGLILMEHYSNLDLPALSYLLRRDGGEPGQDLADRIVAIAGMKLNEDDPLVRAWAECYSRIVIYPSRSLASITDPEKFAAEEAKSKRINMASMRALDAARKRGQVVLVFPSGTRFRPGMPETKKGVREIDSYLRLSDVMILVSINGNCLRISDENPKDMLCDIVSEDVMVLSGSPVMECKKFRNDILSGLEGFDGDKKQIVVDKIMDILNEQHEKVEGERLPS